MSEVGFILLSALFLAVPVSIKYLLAFQMRHMVTVLKRQEREVEQLAMYLEAIEQESLVTRRAMRQVEGQRRQAQARQPVQPLAQLFRGINSRHDHRSIVTGLWVRLSACYGVAIYTL